MIKYLLPMVVICFATIGKLSAQKSDDPIANFDFFWNLFNDNYASFEEKGIDWQGAYDTYRPLVSEATTEEELFDLLAKMIAPMRDAHVTLKAPSIDRSVSGTRPSRVRQEMESIEEKRKAYRDMNEATLLANGFDSLKHIGPEVRDERLFSYSVNDQYGYLRFMRSYSKYAVMVGPKLDSQLKEIFAAFEGKEGLTIDIRFNVGGEDRFSQNIIARLIDKEIIGFKKQTRKNQKFGPIENRYVKPEGDYTFKGKVVLLTNDRTFSAADVLALMMSELPNATIIGEPSNGSYSDLYGKRLPNGWKVTLSNQRYFSASMKNYEGEGTPVDIVVMNRLEDFTSQNDRVIVSALDFLNK